MLIEIAIGHDVLILEKKTYVIMGETYVNYGSPNLLAVIDYKPFILFYEKRKRCKLNEVLIYVSCSKDTYPVISEK